MAESKTKLAQELTPEQLAEFCGKLAQVPHAEQAARILAMAAEMGISIGRSAAYEFKNKELVPHLKRLAMRKEKAAMLSQIGDDNSGQTLADFAAGELGQIAFDLVCELDGRIDLADKGGRAIFDTLTKGVQRLRSGDRAMLKQQAEEIRRLKEEREAADKLLDAAKGKGGMSDGTIKAVRAALGMKDDDDTPSAKA